MPRSLPHRALAFLSATLLALALNAPVPAAHASVPADPGVDHPAQRSERAAPVCLAGLSGLTPQRRMHFYDLKNGKVKKVTRSRNKLAYRVTAWGFFDSTPTKTGRVLRLNAVAKNGVPRQVSATFKGRSLRLSSRSYATRGFSPDLYADSLGFHAYTVQGDKLFRWSLIRLPDGRTTYGQKVDLGGGFRELTSLQATSIFTVRKTKKEILYGTTESGALVQLMIPLKKPTQGTIRTLATSGYEGVTELAWSICDDDLTHHYLAAVSPADQSATWTTITTATTAPEATLRGAITGGDDFDLVSGF